MPRVISTRGTHLGRIGTDRKEAFELKRLVCCGKATWSEDGGKADDRDVDTIRRYGLF